MNTITQTNRTILFEEINPEKLNLLTLVGDVRGVNSVSDDKIKEIKKLIKSASRRKETGLYIVEGIRMVREIPADAVKTLYVAESMTDKFTDICNQIPAEVEIVRD